MRLLHYSSAPVVAVQSKAQGDLRWTYIGKPAGFWLSVEGPNDWLSWCSAERFWLERLTHVHEVELASNAKILRLNSVEDIDWFTRKYGTIKLYPGADFNYIDWEMVAKEYHGIIISPYQWERRLTHSTSWYYSWDCASGCIWDAAAIKRIELVKVCSSGDQTPPAEGP